MRPPVCGRSLAPWPLQSPTNAMTPDAKRTIRRAKCCAAQQGLPRLSRIPDDKGDWTGFDVYLLFNAGGRRFRRSARGEILPLDPSERFKTAEPQGRHPLPNSTWRPFSETITTSISRVAYMTAMVSCVRALAQRPDSCLDLTQSRLRVRRGTTTVTQPRRPFPRQQHEIHEVKLPKLEDVLQA